MTDRIRCANTYLEQHELLTRLTPPLTLVVRMPVADVRPHTLAATQDAMAYLKTVRIAPSIVWTKRNTHGDAHFELPRRFSGQEAPDTRRDTYLWRRSRIIQAQSLFFTFSVANEYGVIHATSS